MRSIRQNPLACPLPDWRNFGILLRILLGANLMVALAALLQPGPLAGWSGKFALLVSWVELPLFASISLLALLRDALWRLPPPAGRIAVVSLVALLAFAQYHLWLTLGLAEWDGQGYWSAALLGGLAAAILLGYLDLRARAFSPAIAEARLMALNARIRPHFLFNSINAVLSLIRAEPRQAEEALETVSDLFRAALRDPSDWLPLSDEIALCRQYLDLEKLRLGERLRVEWDIRDVPMETLLPPLMLQPLVENAVYHGVEPCSEGGLLKIVFERRADELRIEVANPVSGQPRAGAGHHIALPNIRERLALYYDLEARLETEESDQTYRVRIVLPCPAKRIPPAASAS